MLMLVRLETKIDEFEERLEECRRSVAPNSRGLPKRLKELTRSHHTSFMEAYNGTRLSVVGF